DAVAAVAQRHVGVPGRVQLGIAELARKIGAGAVDDGAQRSGGAALRIGPGGIDAEGAGWTGDRLRRRRRDERTRDRGAAEIAGAAGRPAGALWRVGVAEAGGRKRRAGPDRA